VKEKAGEKRKHGLSTNVWQIVGKENSEKNI